MPTPLREILVRIITGTTDATPGTRSEHAHGLSFIPTKEYVSITPYSLADDDTDDAAVVSLVTVDATNITVKSTVASIPFSCRIYANQDGGVSMRNDS